MPHIIVCQCGSKIQVPEQSGGRTFRCPVCKAGIVAPGDGATVAAVAALPGATGILPVPGATGIMPVPTVEGSVCPICQSAIAPQEITVACPVCRQVHHRECWDEVGGCGTYGCEKAPSLEKKAAEQPLSAWGDTKVCPVCKETIKAIAVKCRYCSAEFDTVDPSTLKDVLRKDRRQESARGLKNTIVALFVLSIVSCILAPVMAVINLCVILPKRRELPKLGPLYMIMGYSALGLSLLYSFLVLLFGLSKVF
jgi:hypothetical protein